MKLNVKISFMIMVIIVIIQYTITLQKFLKQRKKFEIRAVDQPDKLTLYSGCDDKSKLLLGLCRDTHQFSMAIAPRVTEAKRREEEGER